MHRPDPVEIVAIALPVVAEVIAVTLFICAAVVWLAIWSGA